MIYRRSFVIGKLDNARMFVERAFNVHDDYVRIAKGDYEFPEGMQGEMLYENALDTLMAYQDIVLRAAFNEINAIVEYELKLIASTTLSQETGKSLQESWYRDRKKAVRKIECSYDIKLSELSGYQDVELVRKTINAYKHDKGYSENEYELLVNHDSIHAEIQKKYELDIDIENCIESAKAFIRALPNLNLQLGDDEGRRVKIIRRSKG